MLRVATSGDYAPFSRVAEDDAASASTSPSPAGFDIDVATRFAADRGYRLEFVPLHWPDLARDLLAGRFDVAMSGVTVRADRTLAGRFTIPVAATRAVALVWRGSGANTLDQLDRSSRCVAVNAGGHLEGVARRVFRHATVVALPDNEAPRMVLLDRSCDGVVTDDFEKDAWTVGAGPIDVIGPLSDDRKAYLLPADADALAAELDQWILAREKDGTLASLRRRHFPESGQTPAADPLAALIAAVVERTALMPFVYEAKLRLRRSVEDPQQESAVLNAALHAVHLAAKEAKAPMPDLQHLHRFFGALMTVAKNAQDKRAEIDAAAAMPPAASRGPDLERDIRPALSRVTARIGRLLVALDRPVAVEVVRVRLAAALREHNLDAEPVEALAEAIARLSQHRAGG